MTAPFDEAAARKLLGAWPEVPGLDDLVAAFVEARATVRACNGEPVAWQWRVPVRAGGHGAWSTVDTEAEVKAKTALWPVTEVRPLYAAPQPAAEAWRPIVDSNEAKLREAYGDDWRRVLLEAVNGAAPIAPAERGQRVGAARLAQLIEHHDSPHNAGSATIGALALDLRDARARLAELERERDRLAAENASLRAVGRKAADALNKMQHVAEVLSRDVPCTADVLREIENAARALVSFRARLAAPAGDPS